MTKQMSISFHSTINMEEHEKNLMTGTLEQRKEAFKEDEELMRETTKFISEVIETAATEASKRKIQSEGAEGEGSRLKGGDTIAGWNNRARGFCNRILNALCPCFTNHELFAWTPYRYRFTRP
ncbi:PREDICTED: uncharacterized protein LOC108777674 [Cyphomyrmex costatus]|uniref:uncharacterized protein LOC108777674 n=1 Tax=Cyphomyrmex costatus TaxID=456900 RepID=UPI00085239DA|nr:PREDICTED: uncharacterized protein LOC108777674 [Cyphomyrmex costatus]